MDYGTGVAADGLDGGESDDDSDGGDAAEDELIAAAEEDEGALDALARDCGISGFTAQLQRAVVQEEEYAEASVVQKRCVLGRALTSEPLIS